MSNISSTVNYTPSGIAYSESGPEDGETIVLIHGTLDRMAGMAHVARLLQKDHHIIRYDRRGYGKSQPHAGPYSIDDQVNDLEEVLGGRRAFLIGHSFGGHVAFAGAVRLGEQVVGASMYESPLSWMPWWPGTTAGNQAVDTDPLNAVEIFMRRLVGDERWDNLPEHTKQSRRDEGPALVGELSTLRKHEPYDFAAVKVPVVCGYGEHGAQRHQDGAKYVASHVQNGIAVMIEGAGHNAPTTHPREYVDAVITPHLMSGRSTLMS